MIKILNTDICASAVCSDSQSNTMISFSFGRAFCVRNEKIVEKKNHIKTAFWVISNIPAALGA